MALAEPRGMRPLIAHCHLGLGKLYWHKGKRDQAQERRPEIVHPDTIRLPHVFYAPAVSSAITLVFRLSRPGVAPYARE